jgi:hypothetical protein
MPWFGSRVHLGAAIAALSLLFWSSTVLSAGLLESSFGTWEGKGLQDDGSAWTIQIVIDRSGSHTVAYPSLFCGGKLTSIENSLTSVTFKENLTYGVHACIDEGMIKLQKGPAGILKYYWFYPDNNKLGASGELKRK